MNYSKHCIDVTSNKNSLQHYKASMHWHCWLGDRNGTRL